MLIVLFLVSHFNFLSVPFGGLSAVSWLPVSFLLHVKYTLSYRIHGRRIFSLPITTFSALGASRVMHYINPRCLLIYVPILYHFQDNRPTGPSHFFHTTCIQRPSDGESLICLATGTEYQRVTDILRHHSPHSAYAINVSALNAVVFNKGSVLTVLGG